MAAYAEHAEVLGKQDTAVFAFLHRALSTITRTDLGIEEVSTNEHTHFHNHTIH